MSKQIKCISLILAVLSIMLFSACSKTETENVKLQTALSIDSSFKGSRTITCSFPQNIVAVGSNDETNLDKVVQKYCPEEMNYTKNITGNIIVYSFQLKFNSMKDYTDKATKIIGSKATVSFSNPKTVLTSGWKLQENFQSSQLLSWIFKGAKEEKFDGFNFKIEEKNTSVSLNNETKKSNPIISINSLTGSAIQKIQINTVNKKNSVYDRTFVFVISQSTFDGLGDKISNYFKTATDSAASSADWLLENNSYLYTVKFTDVSLKELEGYTNKLLSSVYCDINYEDKAKGSTPLAEQNCFYETLDFSNYVGNNNGNVPVEYTYSVEGSTELGECMLYEDDIWTPATNLLDTNIYGKKSAIKSTDSLLNLKISDGKQYTASAIDINVTPQSDDTVQKSITFKYDIATGGNEASDYTKSYFKSMNIDTVQSTENGENLCTVTFSGNDTKLNSVIPDIFGSNNLISHTSYKPFMTLRTMKQFTDHIDFSSLLVGKNTDTPINYYVTSKDGSIIKSLYLSNKENSENSQSSQASNKTSDVSQDTQNSSTLVKNQNNSVNIKLNSAQNDICFDVSFPNNSDIVLCCVLCGIFVLIASAIIFILRKRKIYAASLPQGEQPKMLPTKNKLSKNGRKNKK